MAQGDIRLDPTMEKLNKLKDDFERFKHDFLESSKKEYEMMCALKQASIAHNKSSNKLLKATFFIVLGALWVSLLALFRASL